MLERGNHETRPFLERKENAEGPLGVSSETSDSDVCEGVGDSGGGAELLMKENPEDCGALVVGGGAAGCVARTASAAVPLKVIPPKSDIFLLVIREVINFYYL